MAFREECLINNIFQNTSQITAGSDLIKQKLKILERLTELNEWWVHENRERMKSARDDDVPFDVAALTFISDTTDAYLHDMEQIDATLDALLPLFKKHFNHNSPAFQTIIKRLDAMR